MLGSPGPSEQSLGISTSGMFIAVGGLDGVTTSGETYLCFYYLACRTVSTAQRALRFLLSIANTG